MLTLYRTPAGTKACVLAMADVGILVTIFLTVVLVGYAAVRIAPAIENRWKVWGETLAFLVFVIGEMLILVAFSRL